MSANPAFRLVFRLGLAITSLTFALIVLGSVVRTTGSGLACPDWPLCHGRLIPPLQFNILIEWAHRLVALLVSLGIAALLALTLARPALRARLAGLILLAVALLGVQVVLGALTVWKLLDPAVVSGHLGVALLFFSTLLAFTLTARRASREAVPRRGTAGARGLSALFAAATVLTFAQALLGGMVSTHHAGLACPDWPGCFGEWFPPLTGLVGLQMAHRYGAYLLTAVVLAVAIASRTTPDGGLRAAARLALLLVVAQVVIGVSNVFLRTPVWLSATHLGVATALLGVLLTGTLRAAALPGAAREPAPVDRWKAGEAAAT